MTGRFPRGPVARQALIEQTRRPVPPEYDYSPKNRKQRRLKAKELKLAAKRVDRR